ncbi:hypothetical protein [Acinetobacter genomosp. 15BJ]|uniref:Uncharacterized protein n=1 Tax=Acinetobacter genomosp. 15BJ TaxID=106651 RepID=R9AZH4_9GAMM|nr:hypothetical protein [Acinetobacter genomosp. 15BJ]EOR07577.1 hypothetical protein F896_01950 [Acinetobacter genomosp. 15BJ]MCH7291347.1 hypothetical protein [Acinetobacter genomosp. 15BJ]MDO3657624.1 hypothetical protein [Acinetobacter genomosp. 15BJ]
MASSTKKFTKAGFIFSCLICCNTINAQQKMLAKTENTLGWTGLEIEKVLFQNGGKVDIREFDKRMKISVDKFKAFHESKISSAKSKEERFQAECDYLSDAKNILAIYLSLYPKLLQQPDAKPIFLQSREYLAHFEKNNIKCIH